MKAAVLCPGPSLELFDPGRKYEVTLGINRAVSRFACDYWIALDARTFGMVDPLGTPVIVCSQASLGNMLAAFPAAKKFEHVIIDPKWLPLQRLKWFSKGLTTALVLAAELGVKQINCFGVDWSGTTDWDGYHDDQQHRDAERWADEIKLWQATVKELSHRGVRVTRQTLEGVTA